MRGVGLGEAFEGAANIREGYFGLQREFINKYLKRRIKNGKY